MKRAARLFPALLAVVAAACVVGPQGEDTERMALRGENALEVVRARLLAPGGASLLRRLALPRPGDPPPPDGSAFLAGLVPGTRVETPVFTCLREDEGTDLVRLNQVGYLAEGYLVRIVPVNAPASAYVAELVVAPLPADVSRMPER